MRSVTRTAFILVLVSALLLFSSCDEDKLIEKAGDTLVDVVIGAFEDTATDPEFIDAYITGGMDSAREVAPNIFLRYARNRTTDLSLGDDVDKEAYKWLTENWPLVAKMLLRDGEFGREGLWVRLDTWAKSEGYPGASLNLFGKLTQEQIDFLTERAEIAVIEEYNSVKEAELETEHYRTRTYDWE